MFKKFQRIVPLFVLIALVLGISQLAMAKKGVHLQGVVNINSAGVEELVLLPGVGPSKASAIASYRESEKFSTTEDVMKVKGIGQKLFNKILPYITTDGPTTAKLVKESSLSLETPTAGEES